jgi:transposase
MSKRGSPYLRRAIWLAACSAIMHDPALKAFYDQKKAQGKHHYTCVGYICRKLINIIFAVLKSGKPYQPVFPRSALEK